MKSAIRKMGNSHGVIIPKPILEEVGAKPNDPVEVSARKGAIVITPAPRKARAGWAEASKRLREAGEGDLVWPEFANDADKDTKW
jgi:antitoxin MazE